MTVNYCVLSRDFDTGKSKTILSFPESFRERLKVVATKDVLKKVAKVHPEVQLQECPSSIDSAGKKRGWAFRNNVSEKGRTFLLNDDLTIRFVDPKTLKAHKAEDRPDLFKLHMSNMNKLAKEYDAVSARFRLFSNSLHQKGQWVVENVLPLEFFFSVDNRWLDRIDFELGGYYDLMAVDLQLRLQAARCVTYTGIVCDNGLDIQKSFTKVDRSPECKIASEKLLMKKFPGMVRYPRTKKEGAPLIPDLRKAYARGLALKYKLIEED